MRFHPPLPCTRAAGIVLSLFTGALLGLQQALAAVIILDNGDRLTGEVVALESNTLTLRSGVFGKVDIPWDHIRRLESEGELQLRLDDGRSLRGELAVNEDGVAIEVAGGNRFVIARNALAALAPPEREAGLVTSGQIDLGGTLNRGNSDDTQFNFIGSFEARAPAYRYSLGMEINEAHAGGATTASTQRLRAQYDSFIGTRDYLFVSAKAERDELADLDLRTTLGAGYGRQFIDGAVTRLAGQAGLSFVHENQANAPDRAFPGLGLGLKYDRRFLGGKLIYFQYHDLDISLRNVRDALLRTRLGVRVPIARGISVSTQLSLDYDHRPVPGNEKLDSALIFSLGYAF